MLWYQRVYDDDLNTRSVNRVEGGICISSDLQFLEGRPKLYSSEVTPLYCESCKELLPFLFNRYRSEILEQWIDCRMVLVSVIDCDG